MRAQEFLVEYKRELTQQAWGPKLVAAAKKDPTIPAEFRRQGQDAELIDMVLSQLERADPTANKQYTQGLAKLYANGGLHMEDATSTLAEYLAKFHRLNQKKMLPQGRNDFLKYQHVGDFMSVMDEYPDPDADKKEVDKGQAQIIYDGPSVRVITPEDQTAACYYGQGTRWCTAATKGSNYFDHYNQQGPMYIIIPKKPQHAGEKYQFHFPSRQFMDEKDHDIGEKGIVALAQRMPELTRVFQQMAERSNFGPLLSPEYKQSVADATAGVAEQLQALVKEYQDRIIDVGLQNAGQLKEIGLSLGPKNLRAIAAVMPEYLGQALASMNQKGGFWDLIQANPVAARNEGQVEQMLINNKALQQAEAGSQAVKILDQALKSRSKPNNITSVEDAVGYANDLIVRDALFRFAMRQIPKLYTSALQERGHAI